MNNKMNNIGNFHGSIHGGMGHLLHTYFHQQQLTIPDKLRHIQNLERFDYSIWRDLLTQLDKQLQCPSFGLDIARHVEPKHIGIIAYIAMSCDTLGEAMHRYHQLHRLIFDGTQLELEMLGDHVAIRWEKLPFDMTEFITDLIAMALMLEFLKKFLTDGELHLHEVHFCHPAPKNILIYEQYFRCKIRFSQPNTQLILPIQELSKPFKHSDRTLQSLLVQQAEALLEKLPHRPSASDFRIQQAILQGLQKGLFQIEHIAEQVNMSVRQLQRQLQLQNTSFQERIQAIRKMMSEQYLEDPHLSLQDIALLLGYSEQSAFQRAFKQWTGLTPQQWKNEKLSMV
jgi:AraC-like DNA-binding protein